MIFMEMKEIPKKAVHLGLKVSGSKYRLKLIREEYAIINKKSSLQNLGGVKGKHEDKDGKIYTDKWCIKHQKKCLENYDLHMQYFSLLNHDEFDKEINSFLHRYPFFKQVNDLNQLNGKSGYYILILDEYCQVYVGTAQDILKRIKQHWVTRKSFDRLIFGTVETSIMSIDSFRALDTTRVLAYETPNIFHEEDDYIKFFSTQFRTNRLSGGYIKGGILGAISMIKSRNLK